MTIGQIYKKYHIMPNLQTHMYRVSVVARVLCTHFENECDAESVISATLLHDMGNILKFDLTGQEKWLHLQREFKEKYGTDEYVATVAISHEVGVTQRVVELIYSLSFSHSSENVTTSDYEKKLCAYADMRVAPWGVVSLDERLLDLEKRYAARYPSPEDQQRREHFRRDAYALESQIFAHCDISPSDITDETIKSFFTILSAGDKII